MGLLPQIGCSHSPSSPPNTTQSNRGADILIGEAREFANQGNTSAAASKLRAAVQLNPNNASAFASLGDTLSSQRKFAEALRAYRSASALSPESLEFRFYVARTEAQTADTLNAYQACTNTLQSLIHLAPTMMPIRLTLAGLHMRFAHFANARTQLEEAIRVDGNRPTAWLNLSTVCAKLGDEPCVERATSKYTGLMALQQRAVKLQQQVFRKPNDARAHFELARVLRTAGDIRNAYREMTMAAKLAPGDAEIQQTYAAATAYMQSMRTGQNPGSLNVQP